MLLNFKFNNFRSFRDQTIFTMIPSSKKTHNDYIAREIKNESVRALPVAVIYGANASGKSNIILAMYLLKKIVMLGSLDTREIKPFLHILSFIHDDSYYKPTEFEITFSQGQSVYRYGLSVLSDLDNPSITSEYLFVDNEHIFTRDNINGTQMPIHTLIKNGRIENSNDNFYKLALEKINKSLDAQQLFLFAGIRNLFGNDLFLDIQDWFQKFNVIMDASDMAFKQKDLRYIDRKKTIGSNISDRKFYESDSIREIINFAEFGNQQIQFISDAENDDLSMISYYKIPSKNEKTSPIGMLISSELMESKGTIQLIKLVQPFIDALKTGGTVVLDEMDASLHFEIVVSLIRIFNNHDINPKGAQLIFNTHNPIYLDGTLLRHDQIIMVEKNRQNLVSELFALSDYCLRPEERILKNYLNGKYGALPHMDLEIAFKHILEKEVNADGEASE
nr:ATP-binding protein [uncultured Eisenbergiella sp.]